MTAAIDTARIEAVFRAEYGRAVSVLIRSVGDIDLAQDAVQEAFAKAVRAWQDGGIPPNPAGWIITTAKNWAVDRHRRERTRDRRHTEAALLRAADPPREEGPVHDERLRLIFTCCHPALAQVSQVALTLRLLGGLTTGEIARALMAKESTVAQRLTRAKGKIRDAGIPYRVPREADLPDRLRSVMAVLYLVFNEGYLATGGDGADRPDLAREAIRLGRALRDLMPDEPEVHGLLALMLLIEARRPARIGPDGNLVLLADQDRSRWNRALIEEGHDIVRACLRRDQPGPYQIQAAINAVHDDAPTADDTDWAQILALYDQLLARTADPVAALHRAVALAEVEGPEPALAEIDRLDLEPHHLFHAIRADLLRRLGRNEEAAAAYRRALDRTDNPAERVLLQNRLDRL